ncbi:DUF2721 domain-containing protein [Erysipelothrix sp. HDW6A]|uniref:DUF2721 domain-containing protein n=1 Tax=Erysipelothrix sp. HDW6A TaxID=2714928 RepID=UPI001408C7D2|nr:DUF2721 domain-containing protein [Erysipelothrix sp. HDW6A]QIK57739.1 DUF2721 domain-containing protein [Erysipelothrix sp. HDW6A]
MSFTFDFSLTTPALIFPALSLLMLAYTNRFVVLADLIRDLYERHQAHPDERNLNQIANLQFRMTLIKKMQMFGAVAFAIAAISMLAAMVNIPKLSGVLFITSLICLVISLVYLLKELSVSIDALTIQLDDIKNQK